MDNCGFYRCHTVRKLSAEIEELKEQIEQLSEENRGLKDTVITLRKQIKKMKNCHNCSKMKICFADPHLMKECGVNLDKWELAE